MTAGATTTTLTQDTTYDTLTLASGDILDLNGFNCVISSYSATATATITNSSATLAAVTIRGNFSNQFQVTKFGGALKLTVTGTPTSNGGFQGASNTHTGGTVFSNYFNSATVASDSNWPRLNGNAPFGTGPLELYGTNRFKVVSNASIISNSALIVHDDGSYFKAEKNLIFVAPDVTGDGTICFESGNQWMGIQLQGDLSGFTGTLYYVGKSINANLQLPGTNGLAGTLEINGDSYAHVRYTGTASGSIFNIGELRTTPGCSSYLNSRLVKTVDNGGYVTWKIGSLNTDSEFAGVLGRDSSTKDAALLKVGSGTLTLSGTNEYSRGTTLEAGAIRIGNPLALSSGSVTFTGGTLKYGLGFTNDYSAAIKSSSAAISIDTAGDTVTYATALASSNNGGLTKKGSGTLALAAVPAYTGATTVEAGTLAVAAGTAFGALTVSSGASLAVIGDPLTWLDGTTNLLFTFTATNTALTSANVKVTGLTAAQKVTLVYSANSISAAISDNTPEAAYWQGTTTDWATAANWMTTLDGSEAIALPPGIITAVSFARADIQSQPILSANTSVRSLAFGGTTSLSLTGPGTLTLYDSAAISAEGGQTNTIAVPVVFSAGAPTNTVAAEATLVLTGKVTGASFTKVGAGTLVMANSSNELGTVSLAEGTLALGADQPLGTSKSMTLMLAKGTTLDLAGHDLEIGWAGTAKSTTNNMVIMNSDTNHLATFTVNKWPDCNEDTKFVGNLRYVLANTASGASIDGANYHTGGTVVTNNTKFYFRSALAFGTGPLVFNGNGNVYYPSQSLVDGFTFAFAVEVHNTGNVYHLEGYNYGTTLSFNGALLGDGELTLENGFQPTFYVYGDMTAFTGTLNIKQNPNDQSIWRGLWLRNPTNAGLPLASVVMVNKETNAVNYVRFKPDDKVIATDVTIPFGNLTTETDEPLAYTNTVLTSSYFYHTTTFQIGARGEDGTYSGVIAQENANTPAAVEKVGTGTWALDSDLHAYSGATTVSGGTLAINSAVFTNSAVTVKAGAAIGGIGTVGKSVTFETGSILAPGTNGVGTLTFAEEPAFAGQATYSFTVADGTVQNTLAAPGFDLANLKLKLASGTLDITKTYTLLTGAGFHGTPDLSALPAVESRSWKVTIDNNAVVLSSSPKGTVYRLE